MKSGTTLPRRPSATAPGRQFFLDSKNRCPAGTISRLPNYQDGRPPSPLPPRVAGQIMRRNRRFSRLRLILLAAPHRFSDFVHFLIFRAAVELFNPDCVSRSTDDQVGDQMET